VQVANLSAFPTDHQATIIFVPAGITNPVYTPSSYSFSGDPTSAPSVAFGGFFAGQSVNIDNTVDRDPTSPLTLNLGAPQTLTTTINIGLGNVPVLSSSNLEGPVALLLSKPVPAIVVSLVSFAMQCYNIVRLS
jgi:hypothetical protein